MTKFIKGNLHNLKHVLLRFYLFPQVLDTKLGETSGTIKLFFRHIHYIICIDSVLRCAQL